MFLCCWNKTEPGIVRFPRKPSALLLFLLARGGQRTTYPLSAVIAYPRSPMDAAVDPDAMLVLAYVRGNLAAFETVYAHHHGMLYRFLLRSVRDAHGADELFQETWRWVISARARYQPLRARLPQP